MNTSIIATGKLPSKEQPFYVRFLNKQDIFEILHLQNIVRKSLEVADFLQPLTVQEYEYILSGKGSMIGVFVDDRLIAFRAMLIPEKNDTEHLGIDLGLNELQRQKMLYSEISNVHPDFRGNRLQTYMGKLLFSQIDQQSFQYVATTVAPFNIASLKDKLALDMKIHALKEKYNGKLRYILFRDLRATKNLESYTDKQEVNMNDIARQQQLLQLGYHGNSIYQTNNTYSVTYVKY
ncbi:MULTISPECIES: GNAT family N-acetyltransferase [Clostridia]|uniref:GNAT family N-acetyltransferase n=1 Tax=Clostridia TaxID=186801 RepID=UPI000EA1DE8D|nr:MULTISPECIES: GNAT family N-acetyltransferase [Clostridia]NBJ69868.1 GNAT family N-acetyltransferase [Roseburia sp. 1XD42-34]RKI77670.1 GNAT family N-acetyltransferase [Clostridium sp. 1xD42-85]